MKCNKMFHAHSFLDFCLSSHFKASRISTLVKVFKFFNNNEMVYDYNFFIFKKSAPEDKSASNQRNIQL